MKSHNWKGSLMKTTMEMKAGLLLAGALCAGSLKGEVGPDYVRPATEAPAGYKSPVVMREARPLENAPKGAWWEVFQDRRLNALIADATQHNQQLKGAIARFDQSRANAQLARASFFPTIGTGFVAETQRTSENMPSAFPLNGLMYEGPGYNVPLEFSWELDLWGKLRRQSEAAGAQLAGVAAAMQNMLLTVQADVALNYIRVRTLDAEIEVVKQAVELRRESLAITQARVKAGAGSELELAQAETELATAQAEISGLQVQRDQLENAIAVLSGQNPTVFRLPWAPRGTGTPEGIPVGVPSDLLERRPDIAQAERALAAASAQIGVAKSAAFPSVKLMANGGLLSGEFDLLADSTSLMWNAGPRVTIPLFTGGKNVANFERALAVHDEALAGYRQAILVAFSEVENSLSAIANLKTQAEAQQRATESAAKALSLARTRYEAGTSPYLDVIEADRTALAVRRAAVQIAGQQWLASVGLVKALGGGWDTKTAVEIPVVAEDSDAKLRNDTDTKKKGFFGQVKRLFKRD
jgi:multidrug efflux system outer membrane protein